MVERARMVKDADELQKIRAAVELGAKLFDRALEVLRPGVKENDVAAEMEYAARQAGAEEMSFPTIIASGPRSALPHGRASEQVIARGRVRSLRFRCYTLRLLFGPDPHCMGWDCSGVVPKDARGAYEAVREAQQAAIAAVGPEFRVGEVDEAARKVLRQGRLRALFYAFDRPRRGAGDSRTAAGRCRAEGNSAARYGHHDRAGSILPRQMGREDRGHGSGHRQAVVKC